MYFSEVTAADHKFVEEFRAEIEIPTNLVPWVWMGLSRRGVVENHPTLKIKKAEYADGVQTEVPEDQLTEGNSDTDEMSERTFE